MFHVLAMATTLAISSVGMLALTMTPAAAAPAEMNCGGHMPIDQPLPRQDVSQSNAIIFDKMVRGGHRLGVTHSGEHVTVLEVCGAKRRIRTDAGVEGWVAVATLVQELQLEHDADLQRPTSIEECERRVHDPVMLSLCKKHVRDAEANE